jgi:hypothetical protein
VSEALSPALRKLEGLRPAPEGPLHALVFSASANAIHEIYPLLLDAHVSGGPGVIALHADWLAPGGAAQRAIWLDPESSEPVESALTSPVLAKSIQVLHLNPVSEEEDHLKIESSAELPSLNPWKGALTLRDKLESYRLWASQGLPAPDCVFLNGPDAAAKAAGFLASIHVKGCRQAVLKPWRGTEGRAASRFILKSESELRPLAIQIASKTWYEPMLLGAAMDSLGILLEQSRVALAFRINVSWRGAKPRAESGYAQTGAPGLDIASRGRGGRIVPLAWAWENLCDSAGQALRPPAEAWREMLQTAEAAARVIGKGLEEDAPALMGLDIVLDNQNGKLRPYVLEANPRPAGMAFCCRVSYEGPTNEASICPGLWRQLASEMREAVLGK